LKQLDKQNIEEDPKDKIYKLYELTASKLKTLKKKGYDFEKGSNSNAYE
jgi:hypothetical protein